MKKALLLLSLLLPVLAAGAAADWLVTTDGHEVETDGEWEVRGAAVVFERPGGRLVSMRLSEVDLEASRARTEQAAAGPVEAAPPAPRRPARVVLTDADVRRVRIVAVDEEGEAKAENDESVERQIDSLRVVNWQETVDVDTNSLVITGALVNGGDSALTSLNVGVRLLDDQERTFAEDSARLAKSVLGPGERTEFTAVFPGSLSYGSVDFDLRGRGFRIHQPEASQDPEDASGKG